LSNRLAEYLAGAFQAANAIDCVAAGPTIGSA